MLFSGPFASVSSSSYFYPKKISICLILERKLKTCWRWGSYPRLSIPVKLHDRLKCSRCVVSQYSQITLPSNIPSFFLNRSAFVRNSFGNSEIIFESSIYSPANEAFRFILPHERAFRKRVTFPRFPIQFFFEGRRLLTPGLLTPWN